MHNQIHIRSANQADKPALIQLFEQLGYLCSSDSMQQRITSQTTDQQLLLAEQDGLVLGVIALHIIWPFHDPSKWGFISALVVSEAARGKGVGGQLLQAVENQARAAGCSRIELSSNHARTMAHAFYEQHGYQEKPKRFVKFFD